MRGLREDDVDATLREHREEAPAGRIGAVVGAVQDAALEAVAVGAHLLHPAMVVLAFVLGVGQHGGFLPGLAVLPLAGGLLRHYDGPVGPAFLRKGSPGLELIHVLNLDDIRIDSLNVAEEVLGERPGVRVAGHAALGAGEVGTLQGGPEDDFRPGIGLPGEVDVNHHRAELQGSDVLRVVDGIRVVGLVGGDGVLVMVNAGDDLCDLPAVDHGVLNARRGATGSAEEVDIQELDVFRCFHDKC